ncbi:MAG: sulfurtransferase FdhD [Candidatus Fonsibacter ubiquis]|nr:sulfurtransferase FdhD [Candidatus Fonsibacter ubiquis]
MNSKYKVLKFKSNNFKNVDDLVSIEEPLEISIKYKNNDKWVTQILSITMRTPGHDEDLVRGFLFNEQIVQDVKHIQSIKSFGAKVGQYKIQNKILATLNNSKNINITKIKRDFLTNSSCGVCGKSSLDALEIIKTKKPSLAEPKMKNLNPKKQFIACSGRLNFELVQKVLMTNIGIMIGVGAPTSLAIDLANKYNMTLVGFVKKESFNIYSNKQKIII